MTKSNIFSLLCLLNLCSISVLCFSVSPQRNPWVIEPTSIDPLSVSKWMTEHKLEPFSDNDSHSVAFVKFISALKTFAEEKMKELQVEENPMLVDQTAKATKKNFEEDDYPFFQFLPFDVGSIVPSAPAKKFTGMCFRNSSVHSVLNADGSVDVVLQFDNPKDLLCSDFLLIGTLELFSLQEIILPGTKKVNFKLPDTASDAQKWDLQQSGPKVFVFGQGPAEVMAAITSTAELFEPITTLGVLPIFAEKNLKFLKNYAGIDMVKRNITDVIIDKSQINSGDFFGIIRLDGLDPMLAWGMGSTTGHTTTALWGEDGELYICESTSTTSYWDVNGIQKTRYEDWVKKAKLAGFNAVHIPLSPERRAKMNVTAAWEFFNQTEGVDYGYYNMLLGWIDTIKDNYPCLPPNFDRCLTWDLVTVVFPQAEKATKLVTSLYQQALNHRIGTANLSFVEIVFAAHKQNLTADQLPPIVEDDSWMYETTRYGKPAQGPSMVCCAFVCHIWKASGVFSDIDSEVNCGEATNWDDYALAIFDSNYVRPQECVTADPHNQACQVLGEYTLNLNNYNTKVPYKHMAEHCPSLAPNYTKPANC